MRAVFAYTFYAAAGFIAILVIGRLTENQHWAIFVAGLLVCLVAAAASLMAAFMALTLLIHMAIDEGENE